ncbi:hypothetical protein OGAPHI_002689 [Ogataea philodendri]|uniref:Uncharacterized protein n=1 Tax=Ogataea philodendri TaxID=1378263 RepID=A0A9P8PCG3_9ASCO|nr:uncharacterized protein OGAPHI_002689 [Ogataea philodendri]KAH3668934.1 hypothetical protein OGAPHI_002689 [Ogataea philodendri]
MEQHINITGSGGNGGNQGTNKESVIQSQTVEGNDTVLVVEEVWIEERDKRLVESVSQVPPELLHGPFLSQDTKHQIGVLEQVSSVKVVVDSIPEQGQGEHHILVEETWNHLSNTFVRPSSVNQNQSCQISELTKSIIGRHDGLSTFFTSNTNTHVGSLDHGNIVRTVSNSQCHDIKSILDEFDNGSLLSRRNTATQNGLALLTQQQELVFDFITESNFQSFTINDHTKVSRWRRVDLLCLIKFGHRAIHVEVVVQILFNQCKHQFALVTIDVFDLLLGEQ